jgi:1,4-alpha-glucan branching enzyme
MQFDCHKGMKSCVAGLAHLLKNEPALHEKQFETDGFEWLDLSHREESIISFKRKSSKPDEELIVVLNMTPVERTDWQIVVADKQPWKEIFNSDLPIYWGSGHFTNAAPILPKQDDTKAPFKISLQLPPLGGIVLKRTK